MFASLFSHKALPQAGFDVASCLSVDPLAAQMVIRNTDATISRLRLGLRRPRPGRARKGAHALDHWRISAAAHTKAFSLRTRTLQAQAQPQPQSYQQQSITPLLLSQMSAPELSCELDQAQILSPQMQSQMVQVSSSHCGSPYKRREMRRYQQTAQLSCRRSHPEDFTYELSFLCNSFRLMLAVLVLRFPSSLHTTWSPGPIAT